MFNLLPACFFGPAVTVFTAEFQEIIEYIFCIKYKNWHSEACTSCILMFEAGSWHYFSLPFSYASLCTYHQGKCKLHGLHNLCPFFQTPRDLDAWGGTSVRSICLNPKLQSSKSSANHLSRRPVPTDTCISNVTVPDSCLFDSAYIWSILSLVKVR